MKKLVCALLIFFSVGCTTMSDLSPNAAIAAAYQSVELIVDQATGAVLRGRITPEQAEKILAQSKKARQTISDAETALAICGPTARDCNNVQKILDRVQPILLEMERELRTKDQK